MGRYVIEIGHGTRLSVNANNVAQHAPVNTTRIAPDLSLLDELDENEQGFTQEGANLVAELEMSMNLASFRSDVRPSE